MDTEKTLPELHFQLSRFYRQRQASEDERRALAAADTYFQRLEPRKARLNGRPAMRVATSNRIGEIFDEMGQPLQAEKYYLDAQRSFEAFRDQGLVTLDPSSALVYRNLGNLYYRQTPGVEATGRGIVPGGWDQALKLFETAESGHGDAPGVSYRLGVIHYEKQDFDEAVKRFFALDRTGDRGESSGRDNPNLLYAMGNALFRSGNYASAEGYYRELLMLLRDQRARIHDWDPVGRSSHRALAQRLYETWNNLAAAEYRASNAFRAGTTEFRESLAALTTAQAQAQILGRDLYEDKTELDVTAVDAAKLQAIRNDEANIVARTRQEKGLVEANLQVLSLLETAPQSRRADLARQLEIFARIPLELDQPEAP
jgi:tetratricopeptide (TPR) repeat protein